MQNLIPHPRSPRLGNIPGIAASLLGSGEVGVMAGPAKLGWAVLPAGAALPPAAGFATLVVLPPLPLAGAALAGAALAGPAVIPRPLAAPPLGAGAALVAAPRPIEIKITC